MQSLRSDFGKINWRKTATVIAAAVIIVSRHPLVIL
jgi:hypothetical protein